VHVHILQLKCHDPVLDTLCTYYDNRQLYLNYLQHTQLYFTILHVMTTTDIYNDYYPHVPIGKVWMYRLLFFLFVCLYGY